MKPVRKKKMPQSSMAKPAQEKNTPKSSNANVKEECTEHVKKEDDADEIDVIGPLAAPVETDPYMTFVNDKGDEEDDGPPDPREMLHYNTCSTKADSGELQNATIHSGNHHRSWVFAESMFFRCLLLLLFFPSPSSPPPCLYVSHSTVHAFIHSPIHLFIDPLIHWFVHSSIRPFML